MCSYVDVMYSAIKYVYIKIDVKLNKKVSSFKFILIALRLWHIGLIFMR